MNKTLHFSVSEKFFKASLCCLCLDDCITLERNLDKYIILLPRFEREQSYDLLGKLIIHYKASNVDLFVSSIQDYERISTLDTLKINLLLKCKNNIQVEEELY